MKSIVWFLVLRVLLCGQGVWGAKAEYVKITELDRCDAWCSDIVLSDDLAFVAGWHHPVTVINISTPSDLRIEGVYPEAYGGSIWVSGNFMYTSQNSDEVFILDISDPIHPEEVGAFSGSDDDLHYGPTTDLYLQDTRLYVIDAKATLYIIDVSTPGEPYEEGSITLKSVLMLQHDSGLCVVDPYVFVRMEAVGFCVIDASDPTQPAVLWKYPLSNDNVPGGDVFVDGEYAYVTGLGSTLKVFDIRLPETPTLVWSSAESVYPTGDGLCVSQGYAYVCGAAEIYDVSEPRHSFLAGHFGTDWRGSTVTVRGDSGYAAAYTKMVAFEITELPAITRNVSQNGKLNLQWNQPARGMKLQRTTSLSHPDWQDMHGSEAMTGVELPLWSGPEYFRLAGDTDPLPSTPYINATVFGSITIKETVYPHDVVIGLDGTVGDRRTLLASLGLNNPHLVTLAEAALVFQQGATRVIIGSGQSGVLQLPDETREFLESNGCTVEVLPTPEAVEAWNATQEPVVGIFHVNC